MKNEQGAALVESAFIISLLQMLAIGAVEWGFASREYLGVAAASRVGPMRPPCGSNRSRSDGARPQGGATPAPSCSRFTTAISDTCLVHRFAHTLTGWLTSHSGRHQSGPLISMAYLPTDISKAPTRTAEMKPTHNHNEKGASLVEFAIVMPVLFMILIGIMELGIGFKDLLGASQATREGVRIAAFAGNDPDADCAVLQGIAPFLSTYIDDLDRVEIYQASQNGSQILSKTNIYTFTTGDPTECTDWVSTIQWPSTSRQATVGSQPLDIVGVRIRLEHTWITQFPPFNGSYMIDEAEITRVEPEAFQ